MAGYDYFTTIPRHRLTRWQKLIERLGLGTYMENLSTGETFRDRDLGRSH